MQLHQLRRKTENKRKHVRVGRGGKRGTTSGKGTKGQKARSGHRIRPAVRDLIQRLPKLRGYANKPTTTEAFAINVGKLETLGLSTVSHAELLKAGLISRKTIVKILGDGDLTKKITVEGLKVSESAKKKIEAAGGKVSPASTK